MYMPPPALYIYIGAAGAPRPVSALFYTGGADPPYVKVRAVAYLLDFDRLSRRGAGRRSMPAADPGLELTA